MSEKLKSAMELAMEKYGIGENTDDGLTEDQKNRIAEVRNFYKAKKAELEILQQQGIKKLAMSNPEEYLSLKEKYEKEYVIDRSRLESEENNKIKKIKEKF